MTAFFYFNDGTNTRTVSSEIIVDSYSFTEIYHNSLKSADGSVSFKIPYDIEIANLLKTFINYNVKVQIKETDQNLFTGFIKKNINFEKTQSNQPITLTIVNPSYFLDVTTTKSFVMLGKKVSEVIKELLKLADFTDIGVFSIDNTLPYFVIKEGSNIKTTIDELCFEYGYTFDFDNNGSFQVYPLFDDVPSDLTSITQVFDGTNCRDKIVITAKENIANYVEAKYNKVEHIKKTLLFSDTQNADDNNKCLIEVKPKSYIFDEEKNNCDYDSTLGEVLYVTSIEPSTIYDSEISLSLSRFDEDGIDLLTSARLVAYNSSSDSKYVRQLDIYGDAFICTSENAVISSTGTSKNEVELKYIYDEDTANEFAVSLANYYRYSNFTISLNSRIDYKLGSFVSVSDYGIGKHFGRIIKKEYKLTTKSIAYTIETISEFEPAEIVKSSSTVSSNRNSSGKNGVQGINGKDGSDGYTIFLENSSLAFDVDDDGKVENEYVVVHCYVMKKGLKMPFEFGTIENPAPNQISIESGWDNEENTGYVKVSTIENSLLQKNTITIPISFFKVQDIKVYGDDAGKPYSNTAEVVYGKYEFDTTERNEYELSITYVPNRNAIYRGRKSDVSGFLSPETEVNLHKGDWFTWVNLENGTETYNGTLVTFSPAKVYKWNGNYWEEDYSDAHNSVAFSDVLSVASETLTQNNSTVNETLNRLVANQVFVKQLVASTAFVNQLFTKNLTLQNGGFIQSNNFGTTNGKEGFKIAYDGSAVFQDGTFNNIKSDKGTFTNAVIEDNCTVKGQITQGTNFFVGTRVVIQYDGTTCTVKCSNSLYDTAYLYSAGVIVIKIPPEHRVYGVPRVIRHYASDVRKTSDDGPFLGNLMTYYPNNTDPRYQLNVSSGMNVFRSNNGGFFDEYMPIYFTDNNNDSYITPNYALLTLFYV